VELKSVWVVIAPVMAEKLVVTGGTKSEGPGGAKAKDSAVFSDPRSK
jgi:hypothetical protein